jgi:hypothetical protein
MDLKMGNKTKETLLRRHTNGQQLYEKVFNVINHQEIANQNHNEISLLFSRHGYY